MRIKVGERGHVPTVGTEHSAGIDLASTIGVEITPNGWAEIKTHVTVEIPEGYFGLLCPRSSVGKKGLSLVNTIGIIDSDYRGEIIVLLKNNNNFGTRVEAGDRIAQLLIVPYLSPKIEVVEELTETVRGSGGFGSTGV